MAKTRIMVFGTFDLIHEGHKNMFAQARALAANPYLIVSVARDCNVLRIKHAFPLRKERQRLRDVVNTPLVDKAVLGAINNHIPHIVKERPVIIAFGYDQTNYVNGLKADLANYGLPVRIIRLKAYMPHIHKSSIIKKTLVQQSLCKN